MYVVLHNFLKNMRFLLIYNTKLQDEKDNYQNLTMFI